MKILFIAPFSPPYNGNSLPVKFMYDELTDNHSIYVIDVSKNNSASGYSNKKVIQTLGIFKEVWRRRKNKDLVYITVAESFFGNVRDLVFYTIFNKSLNKIVIHMLGGAGMKNIIEKNKGLQFCLNKFFISKLGGVIVEGKPQANFFSKVIDSSKIHIVPNFAEDFLFTNEKAIEENFKNLNPIKILFLSNLLYGKGYDELVEAYIALDDNLRKKVKLDFAGGFDSDESKHKFLKKIEGVSGIHYHGHVNGAQKKELYTQAHIFCLPTYYPWEGQPFCIIEAYAAGCVVITTNHSGISEIFTDKINGFEVEKKSISSLKQAIEQIIQNNSNLVQTATSNLNLARNKYTSSIYKKLMIDVFNSVEVKD